MSIQTRSKTLIFILLSIISFYFLWVMGLKEILHNYWTRSVQISNLPKTRGIHLKKFDAQSAVYGMELELSGYTDQDIVLLFGPQMGTYQQEILLRKGNVDYDFSSDWYDDECFIYLSTEKEARPQLKLDYRFYGSAR